MPRQHAATSIRTCRCHCRLPATRRTSSTRTHAAPAGRDQWGGLRSPTPCLPRSQAALPATNRGLALQVAPVRMNLIAPAWSTHPLSAAILGGQLAACRSQLRAIVPIGCVVEPGPRRSPRNPPDDEYGGYGATFAIDGASGSSPDVEMPVARQGLPTGANGWGSRDALLNNCGKELLR